MPSFGELLKAQRDRRGLTQTRLADLAGVSPATIQRVEQRGSCDWKPTTLTDVLEALHRVAPLTAGEYEQLATSAGIDLAPIRAILAAASKPAMSVHAGPLSVGVDVRDHARENQENYEAAMDFARYLHDNIGSKLFLRSLTAIANLHELEPYQGRTKLPELRAVIFNVEDGTWSARIHVPTDPPRKDVRASKIEHKP